MLRERDQALEVHERRRRAIENDLQRGLVELQRRSRLRPAARADLEQKLAASAWRLAQTDADLAVL